MNGAGEMREAHDRDYRAKGKFDGAVTLLEEIMRDEVRLSPDDAMVLADAVVRLRNRSDQIVRAWD